MHWVDVPRTLPEFGVCHQSHVRMPWVGYVWGLPSESCQNALGWFCLEFGFCHQSHVRNAGSAWSLGFTTRPMSECLGLVLPGVCHHSHVRMPWIGAAWSLGFAIRAMSECIWLFPGYFLGIYQSHVRMPWVVGPGICHQNHVRMIWVGPAWSLEFAIRAMSECLGLVLHGVWGLPLEPRQNAFG